MASVFKPSGRRIYRIKFIDQHGQPRVEASRMSDRRAAEGLASLIERDVDRIKAGLQPERPDITGPFLGLEVIAPQFMPLAEVCAAYLNDFVRQQLAEKTVQLRRNQLDVLARRGAWRTLHDITTNAVSATLAAMAKQGLASNTTNAYRACLSAFFSWCVDQGRAATNPVTKVKRARKGESRRPKRPFAPEELKRLVDTAPSHRDLYLTAALTGLRGYELSLVERRDFDLDKRVWTCRPEVDKCNKTHRLPIVPDLWPILDRVCAGKSPAARLFPTRPAKETLYKHLRLAGVARLNEDGRALSFHSLRYTFCSLLAEKLPLKTVQRMMRHASVKQTADLYLVLGLDSLIDQVMELPRLLAGAEQGAEATDPA